MEDVIVSLVVGGVVTKQCHPAYELHIRKLVASGIAAGHDVRVTRIKDGQVYEATHSHSLTVARAYKA